MPYLYGYDRKREDFFVTEPGKFNITFALEMTKQYAEQGLVDPLKNLESSNVYIYHGTKDSTVYPGGFIE